MADPISMAMVASTVLSAGSAVFGGMAANKQAQFQAAQMDQAAGQDRASAQRAAEEEHRQATLAQSRLQALAGGGGLDPTIVRLSQDIAGEGELRALTAMYGGEERARGLETAANAKRYEGKQAMTAGLLKAGASILSDGNMPGKSLLDKYGKGGWGTGNAYGNQDIGAFL